MIEEIKECSYPNCGCAEARLCITSNPNFAAISLNRPPLGTVHIEEPTEYEKALKNTRIHRTIKAE